MARLVRFSFPGNIRELANVVEYSMVMASGHEVGVHDLPDYLKATTLPPTPYGNSISLRPLVGLTLREIEERFIHETLEAMDGHRRNTAKMLGISERNLRYRLNTDDKG